MAGERRAGLPTGWIAVAVFGVALVLLLVLFRSGEDEPVPLEERIADVDIEAFQEDVRADLEPVALRPVSSLRVTVRRLVWQDDAGRPFLRAPTVTFAVAVGSAFGGEIVITQGRIRDPELHLVQGAGGAWNYEQVLEPLLNGGGDRGVGGGAQLRFAMRDVRVVNGSVTLRLPESEFAATNVDIVVSSALLAGPGVTEPVLRIATAEALLDLPDSAGGRIERQVSLEDARIRLPEGAVAFEIESGAFGASTFADARGIWSPDLGGVGLDASVYLADVQLGDLPWLPGQVPEGAQGSVRLRIEPGGPGETRLLLTELSLSAPGSAATGSLRAVLTGTGVALEAVDVRVDPLSLDLVEAFTGPLPYTGTLRGRIQGTGGEIGFELRATLATSPAAEPFTTDLTGTVALTDAGVVVRGVTAELDQVPLAALEAIMPGLPLAGAISGTISISGGPTESPIRLDVRFEAGGGVITAAGVVDLTGAVPSYDVSGRLIGVEARRLLEPAAPPVLINAAFDLEGTGVEPATANARIALNGGFTGWRSEPGDTLAVVATTDDGLLRAEAFRLDLGPIHLEAGGEWRFANGSGGAIRYDLEVASLEPLAPYMPADAAGRRPFARGSLAAEGTLTGTLDAPVVAGTVQADAFRYGEWAADSFRGRYDVRLTDALPHIEVEIAGAELRSPVGDFERATVVVDFTRPEFDVLVRAEQEDGGIVELEAAGRMEEEGRREVVIRRAEVDLREQRWRLPSPARIEWTAGEAVRVADLRLEQTGGSGLLRLDGIVAPADEADFEIDIRRLPIGELVALVGADVPVEGILTLDGTVMGPSESPRIGFELSLEDGSIRDVPIRSLAGRFGFRDGALTLAMTGLLGDSARVEVEGTAPARVTLGIVPSFELIGDQPIDARIATRDFPLATLDPGIRTVSDVAGRLTVELQVDGTADDPRLGGDVILAGGAATVPMLDQRYQDIEAVATLNGRVLELERLTATSGGTMTATGRITFEELTDPVFDLTADLNGFEPQGAEAQEDASFFGTLRVLGSLARPRVTGDIRVDDGTLSIAPFQEGAFGQPVGGLIESWDIVQPQDMALDPSPGPGVFIDDLRVTVGNDLWVATEEARLQLRGDLVVNSAGDDFTIQGLLQGDQGTFTLRVGPRLTRRFEIVDANIRFFGSPEPNPALDITASRVVRTPDGGDVEVQVRVGGTLNTPTVTLASAAGASVPESELICFIALGRSCADVSSLAGTGDILTEAFALYGLTDILAEQVTFLDYFEIQMRPGAELGSAFYAAGGEEIIDDVFLLVQVPLSISDEATKLVSVSAEWRIDRQWTLDLAYEPVNYLRNVTGGRSLPETFRDAQHQFFLAVRRRWTY